MLNLRHGVEIDTTLHYVDGLDSVGIDAYWDLDVRLGWRVNERFEASIVGQNLLRPSRPEFRSSFVNTLASEVDRGVYAKVTWKF
jgi:iron complex outermembrane receptor protein